MARGKIKLEKRSLLEAIRTALHQSRFPIPTIRVAALVVEINRYSDKSLPQVLEEVTDGLRHLEGRGVTMTGTRGQRLWHIPKPID